MRQWHTRRKKRRTWNLLNASFSQTRSFDPKHDLSSLFSQNVCSILKVSLVSAKRVGGGRCMVMMFEGWRVVVVVVCWLVWCEFVCVCVCVHLCAVHTMMHDVHTRTHTHTHTHAHTHTYTHTHSHTHTDTRTHTHTHTDTHTPVS
jgi:ABC-type nickel/cobalt efflux system permease component RcnA